MLNVNAIFSALESSQQVSQVWTSNFVGLFFLGNLTSATNLFYSKFSSICHIHIKHEAILHFHNQLRQAGENASKVQKIHNKICVNLRQIRRAK